MDMTNVYFEFGSPCNFCFEQKDTRGISWLKGKKENGVEEYYHVCEKCADIFRKRVDGQIKQLFWNCQYKEGNEFSQTLDEPTEAIEKEIEIQQDIRHKKCHKEKFKIYPEIKKQFSPDEENMLSAYGFVVRKNKAVTKEKKGQQTYIRNRLNNTKIINDLIKLGFVNTSYQGLITLENIISWNGWNEEERKIINEIVEKRNKYLEREDVQ